MNNPHLPGLQRPLPRDVIKALRVAADMWLDYATPDDNGITFPHERNGVKCQVTIEVRRDL